LLNGVIRADLPARRALSLIHMCTYQDGEAWYVQEGALCVHVGPDHEKDVVELRAGSGFLVQLGTPHTFWNPTSGLTQYQLIMTPNIYGMIQEIHALPEKTPETWKELFQKHDSELL
jgi:hypothetical protein